jgi:hypothetical protein
MWRTSRSIAVNSLAALAALALAAPELIAGTASPRSSVAARIGVAAPPARSASSASRSSVYKTEDNSRRYRKQKSKERREDSRKIRDLSKRSRRYRRGHQPGGYCMYDTQGNVILRPEGAVCEEKQGEYLRSTGGAASPARVAPRASSGCFEGNCKNGQGVYVWSNGVEYVGAFKAGRQHGQGLLTMPDGASYDGAWRNGKKHGKGVVTYSNGKVKRGEWKDGRAQSRARARNSRIRWPDLSKAPPKETGGGERDAAVIVGVTRYGHVSEVPGASENAADWYNYLVKTRGVPLDRVSLLLDEDATVEEMRRTAEEAARRVKKKGTLWFVFVGHGAPARDGSDGLLVGFDAQQKARSIEARSLRRSELLAALESSKARNIQVFIDACFSGRTATGTQLVAGLQPLVVQASGAESTDRRTTLMTAAGSDEYAGPLPGADRPAFSYLALGGLRGWADADRDGRITSGELHGYVSQAMRALVRDRRQRPTLVGEDDRRLVKSSRETGPDLAKIVVDSARDR